MAQTTGTSGFGTLLKAGDGATPETFTTIAEIYNIGGPNPSREMIDMTHHESPSDYREKLPSFKDGGQITFDANFLPANSTHDSTSGFWADFENGTRRNFQIVFPDPGTTTASFAGYVMSPNISAPIDDRLGVSVTLEVDGPITWS